MPRSKIAHSLTAPAAAPRLQFLRKKRSGIKRLDGDRIRARCSSLIRYATLATLFALPVRYSADAQAASGVVPVAAATFATFRSSFHGSDLQGGQGPALIGSTYLHGIDDESVARSIREGFPTKGMPAWSANLSEGQILGLVGFLRDQRIAVSPEHLAQLDAELKTKLNSLRITSELESFRVDIVAETGKPWGIAALPDGRLLVTEEAGALRVIDDGNLLSNPVEGTPRGARPTDHFQRALLDVAVHPDYQRNRWIYLTAARQIDIRGSASKTEVSLLRGHLQGNAWVDSKVLATLDVETGTARIAFDGSHHVYVSTSSGPGVDGATGAAPLTLEQLLRTPAQDLKNPRGKIMRWNDDGAVPADNPFVQTSNALPTIWSYGHRNPQGLSFDRKTHELWSTEHGPRGGDELNWIRGGHNYGWPVISYGSRYDGLSVSIEVEHVGMDQPVINWTPGIAVSAISFYEGNEFPRWRSSFLIGSLLKQELWRVVLRDQQAVVQELLLRDIGRRIRAITTGSDGDIYLALELKQQGLVIRLSPSR